MPQRRSSIASSEGRQIDQRFLCSPDFAASVTTPIPFDYSNHCAFTVASNSRFAESTYPSESATLIVDDKLVPVNYDVRVPKKGVKAKATGVRVISTRPPPVDIIEPTPTAPRRSVHTCDDIHPDSIYTCEEQVCLRSPYVHTDFSRA